METEDQRALYGSDYPFTYETVELDEDRVLAALEMLARSVRRIDEMAYDYSWGSMCDEQLREMRAALPDDETAA